MQKNEEKKIEIGTIERERFGNLIHYIDDPNITEIGFNGSETWVTDVYNHRGIIEPEGIDAKWYDIFAERVADVVSRPFNKANPKLEAETENLRIECIHKSAAMTGTVVVLRKTSKAPRFNYDTAIKDYASPEVINLIINAMIGKLNICICGDTGSGKTEFAKFLCQYIQNSEKVVTIEDTPEWHYKNFKPYGDCIEFKVNDDIFTYEDALMACKRITPQRVMLSEVRGIEAKYLMECWLSGAKGITTLHTDDVHKIPDRMLNMMPKIDAERLENNVYECLDVGVLIRIKDLGNGKAVRYIDQMCFYERVGQENKMSDIVYDGRLVSKELPKSKIYKLKQNGIQEPFIMPTPVRMMKEQEKKKAVSSSH